MQTDHPIYQYLATGPEAFWVLTGGITLTDAYQFSSPVLKNIERRIDALFAPQDNNGPVYVVEFQVQSTPSAWYNLMTKVGLYGEEHPEQQVRGLLILPRKRPKSKRSRQYIDYPGYLSAVYLGDFLPELLQQRPHDPFVAALAPLFLNKQELKQQSPQLWQTIHAANLSVNVRSKLEDILVFWFFEKFNQLSEQEILDMLRKLTPIEETSGYKAILAKGILKGMAEGETKGVLKGKIEGKAEGEAIVLKRLIIRRFKKLPKWAETRLNQADTTQLEAWAEAIFDAQSVEDLLKTE